MQPGQPGDHQHDPGRPVPGPTGPETPMPSLGKLPAPASSPANPPSPATPPSDEPLVVVEEDFSTNLPTAIAMFALFPPFALPATIDAYRARAAWHHQAHELAEENAAESRKWSRLALIFGIVSWTLLICCGAITWVLNWLGVIG